MKIWKLNGLPFVKRRIQWSIGIYSGESPFNLEPSANVKNPVLQPKDVTDIPADDVADPFMIKRESTWFMFFEVLHSKSKRGEIGLATSSDGVKWDYKQIVLKEPFHLSYPYVFKWQNEYYMIPESFQANSVRLYKADRFPTEWTFVGNVLSKAHVDASLFRYKNKWWLFAAEFPREDTLRLYYADDLLGPWVEHPESPIVSGDLQIARPGGRVLVMGEQIFRFAQDDYHIYGDKLLALEITELTTSSYKEQILTQNPILAGTGSGWNAIGMHHVDPHQLSENSWIASVDGQRKVLNFVLKK